MERFRRTHASEMTNGFHQVDLIVDKKIVGVAAFQYYSKPLPYYYIASLRVADECQGQGYGSKIMDYVEKMLVEKSRAGVLYEEIDPSSPASGMYARRGWQEIPNHPNLFAFNLPKGADIAQMGTTPARAMGV